MMTSVIPLSLLVTLVKLPLENRIDLGMQHGNRFPLELRHPDIRPLFGDRIGTSNRGMVIRADLAEVLDRNLTTAAKVHSYFCDAWLTHWETPYPLEDEDCYEPTRFAPDRKSTRLNSSHLGISYA